MSDEHATQSQLIALLVQAKALVIRVNSGRAGSHAYNYWSSVETDGKAVTEGVSDLIAVMPDGATWFIEVKSSRGKLRPGQERFKAALEYRGCKLMTADDVFAELAIGG